MEEGTRDYSLKSSDGYFFFFAVVFFAVLRAGSFLRFVAANSSSWVFVIESAIWREAPFRLDFGVSPRLAERAAPAAFCWAFDLAGMGKSPWDGR
jgi:hypothetical protein